MSALFSLIIPVYNSEKNITKCIQSILNQNFSKEKYEIIIINDASSDNTVKICHRYKKENKIIRILNNKKNFGVSYSRNLGIKLAIGKYIIFLDSDDVIKNKTLSTLEKLLANQKVDLLLTSNLVDTKKQTFHAKEINNFFKYLNNSLNFKVHCWYYILNRDFLRKNNIYFKKIRIFEDQVFASKILCSIKKIQLHKNSFHHHNENLNSLSRSMKFLPLLSCTKVINEICKMIKKDFLTYNKRKFLYGRIDFMTNLFKLYLLIVNENQVREICLFINKNINNFSLINNKFFVKTLKKRKFNHILKILLLFKTNAKLLIKNLNCKKFSSVYIFGSGLYGRVTNQLLKKNNVYAEAFIDNNKSFQKKNCLGLKILDLNNLIKLNKNRLKNIIIIISHNDSKIINKISIQLKSYGLRDYNIRIINWKKF